MDLPNDTDLELRQTALRIAAGSQQGISAIGTPPAKEIVERARVYHAFLAGDKEAESDNG